LVKKRRQRPLPIPPRPRGRPRSREFWLQLAVITAFVALVAGMVAGLGYFYFQDWYEENVQRPHSKAVQVGETTFNLDYVARRLKLFVTSVGLQDPSQAQAAVSSVISIVEGEELLRQRAPADLGVSISSEEIELEIGDLLGLSVSDSEAFARAYEQELDRSDLSDKEYRRVVEAELLGRKVQEVFSLSTPQTIEQVRMRQILVGTEDEARSVLERLDAGEDFGDLARELSLDSTTKEQGGERDWLARNELPLSYAAQVFALEVGTPSQPITGPGGYYIFDVQERESDREVTPEQRSNISSGYFTLWVSEQRTLLAVPDIQSLLQDPGKFQWAAERAFGL
jgi:parvulin-like peptidyl-prolyl isomerase